MTTVAKIADRLNAALGKEQQNRLMRGMNPNSFTKNRGLFDREIDDFEDMISVLQDDGGFKCKYEGFFQPYPNSTDSPEIASSYATSRSQGDYLAIIFDKDVTSHHIFGREFYVEEAGWNEIECLISSKKNYEAMEQNLSDIDSLKLHHSLSAPEEYINNTDKPDGVYDESITEFYDLLYTLEEKDMI